MKLLIINGPNLNLIGRREVDVYGKENLDQIINWVSENIENSLGTDFQFNIEITRVHQMLGDPGPPLKVHRNFRAKEREECFAQLFLCKDRPCKIKQHSRG